MRAAIYARVSTDKQDIENQLIELRAYCARSNYIIYEEYSDVVTGKEIRDQKRPGFDKLFKDAHKRYFDIVLFWDFSRFSRAGTLYTLQKLKELENLEIDWESYQEPYFKSLGQFKDVVLSLLATIAKAEREKISERTKAGLRQAQNVGKRGRDKRKRKTAGYFGLKKGGSKKSISKTPEIEGQKKGRFFK